jgi:hypothetical protein
MGRMNQTIEVCSKEIAMFIYPSSVAETSMQNVDGVFFHEQITNQKSAKVQQKVTPNRRIELLSFRVPQSCEKL